MNTKSSNPVPTISTDIVVKTERILSYNSSIGQDLFSTIVNNTNVEFTQAQLDSIWQKVNTRQYQITFLKEFFV